ncbi:MAG: BatD family protein [Muribaculaceae bacterium]|nr:BatD family protein [Muribaculaceae bacterium]
MRIKRIILLLLLVAATLGAAAQQPSFSLIPPRNVVQGRNFSLTFRLSDGDANPPAAPQLKGCTLLYGPAMSTMQSTQIINGRMSTSSSVDFSFTYRADTPGTVDVPEISVSCEGKTLRSRAVSFQILPSDQPQASQGGAPSPGGQQAATPSGQGTGRISADDLLVRVSFSKSSVYEQEPVVATIKVYTKYDISSFLPTTQPAFEGFLCEELPVTLETSIEHYNGQNYHTAVLKRLLLYPQKAGKLSVNSGKYDVTIVQYESVNMGFFRTQRPVEREVTTSSNAATLTVKELPKPAPAGFNGAVGRFNVSTTLEPELMRTNEASVYSYIVKGRGNIKYLSEPGVQFPAGIDAYTPKTEINANVTGGSNMSGTFATLYTIVPQEVGNFTIEGLPFVYFDPETERYETVEVPDTPIKVLRGNSSAAAPQQSTIDNVINDILHIKPIDSERQYHEIDYTFGKTYYWLAYALVALILVLLVVVYRRHIRMKADVSGRKLAKAGRVATKRLREARAAMDAHDSDRFYASVAKALWGYISDKLSISASQLTRDNVAEKLRAYGLPDDATDRVLDVLDQCEMARFTPAHSDAEIAGLYDQATAAIKNIEDVKKH